MKCPKCGFTSFDFLENCKKCGNDLQEHKSRFGLRSLIYPGVTPTAPSPGVAPDEAAADLATPADSTDFGFDFMSEESPETTAAAEDEEGFDFPAEESGGDDFAGNLGAADDNAFDFTEDSEDQIEATDVEEPIEAADTEPAPESESGDDFDFDNWDDVAEEDTKKKPGDGEEPADPFDFREPAAVERAPETSSDNWAAAEEDFGFAEAPGPEPSGTSVGAFDELPTTEPQAASPVEPGSAPETAAGEELFPLEEEPSAAPSAAFDGFPADRPQSALDDEAGADITWAAESAGEDQPATFDAENASEVIPLPPLTNRIAATTVDVIILAVVFLLFLIAGELTAGDGSGYWLPSLTTVIDQAIPYFLVLFALCFGYFTLFHFLTGQTPGKMLCALRVESANGTPLKFSQAFLRSIGGLFALLPCGLGYLSVLVNRQGRGWNDRFADSRLIPIFTEDDGEETGALLEP